LLTEPPAATTYTVTQSDLWDNGYDNSADPRQSTGSRFVFATDADNITISGTTTIYEVFPTYAHLGLRVNGVDASSLSFAANGADEFDVALPGSGTRTVEIISGLSTKPDSTVLGSFIDSVGYPDAASFSVITPTIGDRVLFYGDSITVGGNATNPESAGYVSLVRNGYNFRIMTEGWGYRSLYDDTSTTELRGSFVSRLAGYAPVVVWLAIGTNDYGLNKWSATSFGTAYAATVDDLHISYPSATIVCQTPLLRDTETANGSGNILQDYRDQITSVCGSRGWAWLVDGYKILLSGDLADGLHPSATGHAKYAAFVAENLKTRGRASLMMGM
jgi:lysophospholipase L1-like esterase